jgi:cruciform cutting endonuclease 1
MAPKLKPVTAKALQALLTRIGSASSGIKTTLQERFRRDFQIPLLFNRTSVVDQYTAPPGAKKTLRIMSVDMGIKNLAFCDARVSYPEKGSLNTSMKIIRWEKVNLVPDTVNAPAHNLPSDPKTNEPDTMGLDEDEDVDPYSLDVLSTTAYRLVKRSLLHGAPDIILIEKQRWRSGGGSAILQWTIRVNTFEGMLWAVLRTLLLEAHSRYPEKKDLGNKDRRYEVFGVDPKRVGYYWLGQNAERLVSQKTELTENEVEEESTKKVDEEESTKKKESRTKMEKKAKIALLRSWLTATPASTTSNTTPTISFTFDKDAENTLRALTSPSQVKQRKKKKNRDEIQELLDAAKTLDIPDTELKKLDDITDCFLQAAAWVSWDLNRLQLQDVWARMQGANGSVPEITDEVLRSMVEKVERR